MGVAEFKLTRRQKNKSRSRSEKIQVSLSRNFFPKWSDTNLDKSKIVHKQCFTRLFTGFLRLIA